MESTSIIKKNLMCYSFVPTKIMLLWNNMKTIIILIYYLKRYAPTDIKLLH